MKPPTVFLGEMTNPEVEAFLEDRTHRHHPDRRHRTARPARAAADRVLIPQEIARRVAPHVGAVVAPPINYALSYPHVGFTGLVHIRIPTFMALDRGPVPRIRRVRIQADRVPQRALRQHLRDRVRVRECRREDAAGREGVSRSTTGTACLPRRSREVLEPRQGHARERRGDLGHPRDRPESRRHGEGQRRVPAVPRVHRQQRAGPHGVLLQRAWLGVRGDQVGHLGRRRGRDAGNGRGLSPGRRAMSTLAVLDNIERTFQAMPPRA